MSVNALTNIKFIIENEINKAIKIDTLKKTCCALKADGTKCTNKIKSENETVCKMHKSRKTPVKLAKERTNKFIVYHNHLPTETNVKSCPKCNLVK